MRFSHVTQALTFCLVLLGAASPLSALSSPDADTDRLDDMNGQMILVGFPGITQGDQSVAAVHEQLAKGVIGGVVLYPENIRSPEQLKSLTAYLRDARSAPVPFIAVDQEGCLLYTSP